MSACVMGVRCGNGQEPLCRRPKLDEHLLPFNADALRTVDSWMLYSGSSEPA